MKYVAFCLIVNMLRGTLHYLNGRSSGIEKKVLQAFLRLLSSTDSLTRGCGERHTQSSDVLQSWNCERTQSPTHFMKRTDNFTKGIALKDIA